VALTYACVCLGLYLSQRQLIFRPAAVRAQRPDDWQLPYESVRIPIGSEHLQGWWIARPATVSPLPLPGEPARIAPPDAVMLYFVGVGRNIGDANYLARAQALHQLGFSVLMVDYRGYGESTPRVPSESQLYADAEAVWRYAVETLEYVPEHIWIYGESMGGAIALDLAIRHPEAQGLILQSTFTRMVDAIQAKLLYRLLPVDQLLTQRFDSIHKVHRLDVPVLFLHGGQDTIVPVEHSYRLYGAAPQPKQQFIVPGGDHVRLYEPGENSYLGAITRFVGEVR